MKLSQVDKTYRRLARYIHNSLWIVGEKAIGVALSFAVTIFVARYLGPGQYGSLAYALSMSLIFATAGHLGLSGLVVRDIVKLPDNRAETVGTSILLRFAGVVLAYAALVAYALAFEEAGSVEFLLIAVSGLALFFRPAEVLENWFEAFVQARNVALARLSGHVVANGFKLLLVASAAGLLVFGLAPVVQACCAALVLFGLFRAKASLKVSELRFSRQRARELLSQGWIIYVGSVLAVVYLKIDLVMLRWLADNSTVGQYAVAAQFSEALYFVPAAVVASIFPKLIEIREQSESQFYFRLQQLLDLLFAAGLSVAVVLSLAAPLLISGLFGDEYAGSAAVLVIHVWSGVFVFMRAAVSKWILIEGVLYFSILTQGLGAVSNIVLNYLWIPAYGGIGAAWATLCSYAVAAFFALLIDRRTRPVFWHMVLAMLSPVRYPWRLIRGQVSE